MSTASKKITSIFFLGLGVFPLLFMLAITLKKQGVRIRMREKMEYQSLQTIVISENEVVWMDKQEIWVNNKMFDISSGSLKNGYYTFTGLYDEEETLLVNIEKEASKQHEDKDGKGDAMVDYFFKCLQTLFPYNSSPAHIRMDGPCIYTAILSPGIISQFREILTPPPRIFC